VKLFLVLFSFGWEVLSWKVVFVSSSRFLSSFPPSLFVQMCLTVNCEHDLTTFRVKCTVLDSHSEVANSSLGFRSETEREWQTHGDKRIWQEKRDVSLDTEIDMAPLPTKGVGIVFLFFSSCSHVYVRCTVVVVHVMCIWNIITNFGGNGDLVVNHVHSSLLFFLNLVFILYWCHHHWIWVRFIHRRNSCLSWSRCVNN